METPLVFPDVEVVVPVSSPPSKGEVIEKESVPPSSQNAPSKKTQALIWHNTFFVQIIGFRKGNCKSLNLSFPHLIYKVLSMQNEDIKLENEDLVLSIKVASFRSDGPCNETGKAPSAKKSEAPVS